MNRPIDQRVAQFRRPSGSASLEDRLSDLCNRMEQMSAESNAGDVEDVAAMDRRIDGLIRAVGDLAYLMWLRETAEQVSA